MGCGNSHHQNGTNLKTDQWISKQELKEPIILPTVDYENEEMLNDEVQQFIPNLSTEFSVYSSEEFTTDSESDTKSARNNITDEEGYISYEASPTETGKNDLLPNEKQNPKQKSNYLQSETSHLSKMTIASQSKVFIEMYDKETICRAGALLKWENDQDASGNLTTISDAAFLSRDQFVISQDSVSKPGVQIYDVNQQGVPGFVLGEAWMRATRGLCVTQNDTIAVIDSEVHTVKLLNRSGDSLGVWKEGLIESPGCIQITSDGKYIISDISAQEEAIKVFSSEGRLLKSFGMTFFDSTQYFALDSHDRVIISEQSSSSIVIFNKNGKFVQRFGTRGKKDGQLNSPSGITVDHLDNILVADTNNFRISMFSPDGRFIKNIVNHLQYRPVSLAFSDSGHLVVASNNAVYLYQVYEQKDFL